MNEPILEGLLVNETFETQGLCSTCKNCETCMYIKTACRPVLQCEEFEPFESRPFVPLINEPLMNREQVIADMDENMDLKGLCVNCEKRYDCKFPKQPGGVWHCEEYE